MTPGSDATLGTFTASTTPTDGQAQSVIDDACSAVLAAAGPVPATGQPNAPLVQQAPRTAAGWRAAAPTDSGPPAREPAQPGVHQPHPPAPAGAPRAPPLRAQARTRSPDPA